VTPVTLLRPFFPKIIASDTNHSPFAFFSNINAKTIQREPFSFQNNHSIPFPTSVHLTILAKTSPLC
jgi:hypothetical protein